MTFEETRLYAQQLVKEIEEETVTKENFVTNPHFGKYSVSMEGANNDGSENTVPGMEPESTSCNIREGKI